MENLEQIHGRVERYLRHRLSRLSKLIAQTASDPRDPRGVRHTYADCVLALLAGVLSDRKSLRDVEELSGALKLGRRGGGISDGALTHLLALSGEHDFDGLHVRMVKDMAQHGTGWVERLGPSAPGGGGRADHPPS